ncbi:hypothetical protein AALA54_03710 [Oscillospiraceae bacterium 44-34]
MYNRYIPADMSYTRVEENSIDSVSSQESRPHQLPFRLPELLSGKKTLFDSEGLSGLLKSLHLDRIDSGDVLLLLIMLYLLVEGDDLELVIALGLVLLMGLGEDSSEKP